MFILYKHMTGSRSKSKRSSSKSKRSSSKSKSKFGSRSGSNAMVSTKLMIEFMTLYNNRNDGILSSDEVFSNDDINKLSDAEYLKGVAESTGHVFSILEVQGLLNIINRTR